MMSWRTGAGLTIGRDLRRELKLTVQPTIWFRDSAPAHKVLGVGLVHNSHSVTRLADGLQRSMSKHLRHQVIAIRCLIDPHGSQGGDDLALHSQSGMNGIVGGLKGAIVSALEAILITAAQGGLEGFARHI